MVKGDDKKYKGNPGALFIPAGVLIGLGVGFLINKIVGGALTGLGLGFLCFAVYEIITRKR
jgi:hypothetical protein